MQSMLGYVASFFALISLLVNSSMGCCWHCLPGCITSAAATHARERCNNESCCHLDEDECCDEHPSGESEAVNSGCGPHSHDSGCPCRPGRCVHATISTGIAPQSTFPAWVCCRSCMALSDLSKPVEQCSLTRHDTGNQCCLLSASFMRSMTQIWLI
jgi:hypothetical protein